MPIPIISPAGPLVHNGLIVGTFDNENHTVKTVQIITADQDVVWSTNGGILLDVQDQEVTWESPNTDGTFSIVATNGALELDSLTIVVKSVLPPYWDWRSPARIRKKILTFEPDDGPEQTREYGGGERYYYDFTGTDRDFDQLVEMREFWKFHHPNKKFLIVDPSLERTSFFKTDSDFDFTSNPGGDSFDWRFAVKEAHPYGSS